MNNNMKALLIVGAAGITIMGFVIDAPHWVSILNLVMDVALVWHLLKVD